MQRGGSVSAASAELAKLGGLAKEQSAFPGAWPSLRLGVLIGYCPRDTTRLVVGRRTPIVNPKSTQVDSLKTRGFDGVCIVSDVVRIFLACRLRRCWCALYAT